MESVAVLNNGPVAAAFDYDGKTYEYPVGEPVVVPMQVANFHFAVEATPSGKLVRNKSEYVKDEHGGIHQSWYYNRLASYSPYGLLHGNKEDQDKEKFKEFREWFDSGVTFKLIKSPKGLTKEQFAALK